MPVDPSIASEIGVVVGAVIFLVRTLSPGQRSRRRRQEARDRIELRRALYGHAEMAGAGVLAVATHDGSDGDEVVR
jgi:hypothetical protein